MSERKTKPKKFRKRGQDSNNSSSSSSSSESTSSLSSDDESNAKDLKPIKDYLADRKELARQLFIAVKGDKLRMMLPQVLKKMDINELQEWCATELSGMSRARISSILSGQPMLQSSDSNDTDDSGPSLEIISDTEEWGDGSDVDAVSQEVERSSKKAVGSRNEKTKSKSRAERGIGKKEKESSRNKLRTKVKMEGELKTGNEVTVKKENEPEQAKEKDGESLLDLLELEMRARAIRALIRKEEDIIPTATQAGPSTKSKIRDRNMSLKVVQDKLDELDTSFRQSVDNGNRNKTKNAQTEEEEDVVLVLEPTTTIELLSSENEDETGQGKRRNQRLENERVPGSHSPLQNSEVPQNEMETDKGRKETGQETDQETSTHTLPSPPLPSSDHLPATPVDEVVNALSKTVRAELETSQKVKKKAQDSAATEQRDSAGKELKEESNGESVTIDTRGLSGTELESKPSGKGGNEEGAGGESRGFKDLAEEEKSTDLEVIDLDDYPDDMEGLESTEERKKPLFLVVKEESKGDEENEPAAETWATRYYQTDDVQSVIKESKIQSEIRKRLRERQRLARLNTSPGLGTLATSHTSVPPVEKVNSPATTGSVEEYLALKNVETLKNAEDLQPGDTTVTKGTGDLGGETNIVRETGLDSENSGEEKTIVGSDITADGVAQ